MMSEETPEFMEQITERKKLQDGFTKINPEKEEVFKKKFQPSE